MSLHRWLLEGWEDIDTVWAMIAFCFGAMVFKWACVPVVVYLRMKGN